MNITSENKQVDNQKDEFQSVLDFTDRLRKQKAIDVDENWGRLYDRIHREDKRINLFTWVRNIAAVMMLPLLLVSSYLYMRNVELKTSPSNQMELIAAYGTRTKVVLSDGSEVWLNSGSRLIYPDRFTEDCRQVVLSGEAFFKVKSDAEHRFDVKTTDGIVVSAYGTEFNVEAYEDEEEISATLVKGSIGVERADTNQTEFVAPGEQLVYSKHSKDMLLKKVNLLVETGWKDGKLVFRRTPLSEVAKHLSRHFNVDVELKGKTLLSYTYSATFTTESLTEILSLLERTAPIRCEIIQPKEVSDDHSFTKKKILIREK